MPEKFCSAHFGAPKAEMVHAAEVHARNRARFDVARDSGRDGLADRDSEAGHRAGTTIRGS
jgi:hypothetical protein